MWKSIDDQFPNGANMISATFALLILCKQHTKAKFNSNALCNQLQIT